MRVVTRPPELPYTPVLLERIRALHRCLEASGFPHAFGGAIALGVHAEPRFTSDIDINVIADPEHPDAVLAVMPDGVEVPESAASELRSRGQIRLWWPDPDTPVDLFLPQHPAYHQLVNDRSELAEFLDTGLRVVSATDLMVFKMLFNRRKDWADIAALVEAGAGDPTEAAAWIIELLGPEDDRLGELQKVLDESRAG